jgi:hypothetical protein
MNVPGPTGPKPALLVQDDEGIPKGLGDSKTTDVEVDELTVDDSLTRHLTSS